MGGRFKRVCGSIVSVFGLVAGLLLFAPWKALDWIGRIMAGLDSQTTFDHLIDWLAANPRLAFDFGPWILIMASLSSLAIIHMPIIRRLLGRASGPQEGTLPDSDGRHFGPATTGQDISWAWEFIRAELLHEPKNETMAWQIYVTFRNRTTSSLRNVITRRSVLVEQLLPDIALQNTEVPSVIPPGAPMTFGLPPYSAKPVFKNSRIAGKIDIAIKYGLAGDRFSRVATFLCPLPLTLDLR